MVTFRKPIGSVSVSGHKFVGAPVPCGVVITRFKHVLALSSDVEYLNSRDATIMGSRNGHAPIYLWYTLTRKVSRSRLHSPRVIFFGERSLLLAGSAVRRWGVASGAPAQRVRCWCGRLSRRVREERGGALGGGMPGGVAWPPGRSEEEEEGAEEWCRGVLPNPHQTSRAPQGYEGMRQDVERCMRNAHTLKQMLESAGVKTMLNELSNTVRAPGVRLGPSIDFTPRARLPGRLSCAATQAARRRACAWLLHVEGAGGGGPYLGVRRAGSACAAGGV